MHIHIVYHRITLFPLCGRKKIKQPANIGKTAIIVKQGKWFVVKTRYTWARKIRAQLNFILSTDFVGKKKKEKWIQVEFYGMYQ